MSGFSGGIPTGSAPPFPDAAFHNVTITGSQNAAGGGGQTIGGAVSIGGGLSVNGASATVPSATFTTAETLTGANTGTLTNCPHSGDPFTFLEIRINGTLGAIPVYATT